MTTYDFKKIGEDYAPFLVMNSSDSAEMFDPTNMDHIHILVGSYLIARKQIDDFFSYKEEMEKLGSDLDIKLKEIKKIQAEINKSDKQIRSLVKKYREEVKKEEHNDT